MKFAFNALTGKFDLVNGVPNAEEIDVVGMEDILGFDPVTAKGFVADSNNLMHRLNVVGVALKDINTGFSGKVVVDGEISNPSWSWTIGNVIYLNQKALSEIAPTGADSIFSLQMGVATKSDTITVKLLQSMLF